MERVHGNIAAGPRKLSPLSLRGSRFAWMRSSGCVAAVVLSFGASLCVGSIQGQLLPANSSPAPFAGAIVSEWKGEVHIQVPGKAMAQPARGQALPAGTTIDTGDGQLLLVLRTDESEILIQPHTRVTVKDPSPGSWDAIEVALGRIRAYIRKRTGGAPPFQMGTPSAVIAVRGTRFDVEVNRRSVTEVDVFDGLVEVASSTVSGPSVLVNPGFSTRVGLGTAPEPAIPTREIRPGVNMPEQVAKLEFSREWARQADRAWENELAERPDKELDDLADESRESEKGSH